MQGQKASGSHGAWSIAAGVISTLQAGGYLGLGIAALALYYCEIIPESSKSPGFLLYVTYFYNPACVSNLNNSITWPDTPFPTAERTWQWAITYCALDALWLFSSIFLTVAGAVRSQKVIFKLVIPIFWLITTGAILVADITATVLYGVDLSKILNASSSPMLALLDTLDPKGQLYLILQDVESSAAIIPSVAMLITVTRGALLWLLNLTFFIAILLTTTISKKSTGAAAATKVGKQKKVADPNPKVKRGEFFVQPSAGTQNPAYDISGDDDAFSAKQRRRPRDADILAAEAAAAGAARHDELRNQRPWSYLEADGSVVSQGRPRTPPAEEWQYTPQSTLKLPRATLAQPSAPHHTQPPYNQQYYHYPYPEQNQGNRYMDIAAHTNRQQNRY